MRELGVILSDRGSRYAVSGGPVSTPADAQAAVDSLRARKPYAKATHNSWAVLFAGDDPLKSDDGEAGAADIILRMLTREGLENHLIVVTRWYGGKHLGGDRFRHVRSCVRAYLAEMSEP